MRNGRRDLLWFHYLCNFTLSVEEAQKHSKKLDVAVTTMDYLWVCRGLSQPLRSGSGRSKNLSSLGHVKYLRRWNSAIAVLLYPKSARGDVVNRCPFNFFLF